MLRRRVISSWLSAMGGMLGECIIPILSRPFLRHVLITTSSPGRWLVSQILKLLMAYITLHYDIQPLDKRPPNTVFADTNIPNISATIRVRRRKCA